MALRRPDRRSGAGPPNTPPRAASAGRPFAGVLSASRRPRRPALRLPSPVRQNDTNEILRHSDAPSPTPLSPGRSRPARGSGRQGRGAGAKKRPLGEPQAGRRARGCAGSAIALLGTEQRKALFTRRRREPPPGQDSEPSAPARLREKSATSGGGCRRQCALHLGALDLRRAARRIGPPLRTKAGKSLPIAG